MGKHSVKRYAVRYSVGGFVLAAVGFLAFGQGAGASSPDPVAQAIKDGLTSFATNAVGELGSPVGDTADHLAYLAKSLPMSDLLPLGDTGLALAQAENPIKKAIDDAASTALDSIPNFSAALDGINQDYSGVHVVLGCGDSAPGCTHAGVTGTGPYTLTLPVKVTRNVPVPLHLATDAQNLLGSTMTVKLSVTGSLSFGYDATRPVGHQFYLNAPLATPPSLSFAASIDAGALTAFNANLGFTKIAITPSITSFNVAFSIALNTPHTLGDSDADRITSHDWETTQLQDLATVTRSGSYGASLALDSDLIPGTPDVTVSVNGSSTDGFMPHFDTGGTPSNSLSSVISNFSLADFQNVTPTQVLSGLGQLAATIQAFQTTANVPLPFLKEGIAAPGNGPSALKIVNDLITALSQQTVACGPDTSGPQPSGSLVGLTAGTKVYCVATTTDTVKADSITWSSVGDTAEPGPVPNHLSGLGANNTIGSVPSVQAVFTVKHDFVPPIIIATYKTPDDADHGVSMPVPDAQELFNQLVTTMGLGDSVAGHLPAGVAYDATTKALTFHLVKKIAAPSSDLHANLDFASRLQDKVGLVGLSPDSGASVTARFGDVVLDLTFGVLLNKNLADITPHSNPPTFVDRFFVKSDGTPLTVDTAKVNATVKLAGSLGFLGVTAEGASAPDCTSETSTAFCLKKVDDTKPALKVGLDLSAKTVTGGSGSISNATTIPDLLGHLTDYVSVTPNLLLAGGLKVTASVGGTELTHGGLTFSWPITSAGELTNPTALNVVADSDFQTQLQKFWEMAKNDPQALFQVVLNALRDFAEKAAATNGTGGSVMDTQLPLVNTSPRQLLQQFTRMKTALDEIASGTGALVQCTNETGQAENPPRDAGQAVAGDHIKCQATITTAAPTAVQWTVVTGNGTAVTSPANDTALTTIGASPTQFFTFVVPANVSGYSNKTAADGTTLTYGYHVHVAYTDPAADHTADLPALPSPKTLQDFVTYFARKLGLADNVLTANIISTPKPGSGSPVPTLKLGFKYDICTDQNSVVGSCAGGRVLPTPTLPLNAKLEASNLPGITPSLTADGTIQLQFNAHAQIDVGFPLDGGLNTLPTPEVLGSTGASVAVAASSDDFGAQASLGPLSIAFGNQATKGHDNTAGTVFKKLRIGGKVTVGKDGAAANDAFDLGTFAGGLHIAFANNGAAQDCDTIDKNYTDDTPTPDPTAPELISGFACATATMNLNNDFIGDLGIKWANFDQAPELIVPDDLVDKIKSAAFNIDFLLKALPQLLDDLKTSLSSGGARKVPLIGNALDAGANVVDQLNKGLVIPVTNGLSAAIGTVGSPNEMATKVDTFLFNQLASAADGATGAKAGILLDTNNDHSVTAADVGLKLMCQDSTHSGHPYDCTSSTETDVTADGSVTKIQDASIDLTLGQGFGMDKDANLADCANADPTDATAHCKASDDHAIPFDIGLDGLPFRVTGKLLPSVGWKARINFGLDRNGPYVVVNHSGNDVEVGAGLALGDPGGCAYDANGKATLGGRSAYDSFKNSTSCLNGTLGFLQVRATDTDGTDAGIPHTGVKMLAGVKLTRSDTTDPDQQLHINEIDKLRAAFVLKAEAHANLLLHASIAGDTSGSFPSVYGLLKANWDWGFSAGTEKPIAAAGATPSVSFTDLNVDVGELIHNYLQPVFNQIKSVTSPLKPVIDVLQAPIPVVSQLAELVGQPPVTLIDLAQAASGANLSLVKSIISFLNFINNFPLSDSGLMSLDFLTNPGTGGAFQTEASLMDKAVPESAAASLVSPAGSHSSALGVGGFNASSDDNKPVTDPDGLQRPKTFGVPGLDIPLIRDPGLIFKLLMGSNIDLITYDFGNLSAKAGFEYTFGPFMVGPVPVSIVIGGSVEIKGSLIIGYDTTGLREVLSGGGPEKLLDGLFFGTYRNGQEVPVVSLIGTVYAGAEVDLVIVKAGIEAGLTLTVNFYWDDPTPDGKMGFQDIGNKLSNPICLFRVTGSLDAFIKAFVEIDLFFFSDRFEFTILNLHLLDFSAACSPPTPHPATQSGHTLILNIGSQTRREARGINVDEKNEKITVRPLPPSTHHQFGVTIFGAYEEYGDPNPASANFINLIQGDGDDGSDEIVMQAGADSTSNGCTTEKPCTIPFTTATNLKGGSGTDTIVGGDGPDVIDGGADSDKMTGNAGNDHIGGGGGADQLDGGIGDDYLCSGTLSSGGSGNTCTASADSVTESGGPGSDHLTGSTAADQLNGGPGLDANAPDPDHAGQTYGQTKTAELDGGDTIVGLAGPDQLTGGPGNDHLYGDEQAGNYSCTTDDADPASDNANNDSIDAGQGSDEVWGGSGNDTIKGGAGTQGVVATGDNDFLCGGEGNDDITGDPLDGSATGNDRVLGGAGNDFLTGGPGNDYVSGGPGNDVASGGTGDDDVLGGTGRDFVNGDDNNDIVIGEEADVTEYNKTTGDLSINHAVTSTVMAGKVSNVDDTSSTGAYLDCKHPYTPDHPAGLVATDNSDCVNGSSGNDAMFGGGGKDTMTGADGDDWMSGGNDADKMSGGYGDDIMRGDAGDDVMGGDSGNDHMYGNADKDTMSGSQGADYMEGNGDVDTMSGDQGNDWMIGGSSTAGQPDAGDTMNGGADQDTMVGDNGTITGDGAVTLFDDCTNVGGKDTMTGDEADDWMFGGNNDDTMSGGGGKDYMEGNAGTDTIHGDDNDDRIIGGSSNNPDSSAGSYLTACDAGDNLFGDQGADVMLGDNGLIAADGTTTMATSSDTTTFGDDTMRGGAGQDQMYGQLGADTITGDQNEDYILGDLGAITAKTSGPDTWPGGAPNHTVALIAPNEGGADVIYGGSADDHVWSGAGNDTTQGGAGDDYLEGNGGQDSIYGLSDNVDGSTCNVSVSPFDCDQATTANADITGGASDQDDIIGGSSGANPAAEKLDAGETIVKGNLAQDVILGDNGTIVRSLAGANWAQDAIIGGAARTVTLTYSDRADCSTGVCGGDTIEGDGANDRIYGEGGNDVIDGDATSHTFSGAAGDDYVEGNQNTDTIHGNGGNDDLIGGNSEIASGSGDAAVGRPDTGDTIFGDDGADVIAGDNAIVSKLGLCPNAGVGDVITQRPGMSTCQRTLRLLDLGTSQAGTFGDDTINGGNDVDVIFGQSGTDTVHGDAADDYLEGNQNNDVLYGDDGQDDIVGGSSKVASGVAANKSAVGEPDAGDVIRGGNDQDVVLGDNGAVLRVNTTAAGTRANTLEDATKGRGMTQRTIVLYDLGDTPTAGTSGGDYVEGNADNDVLLAQSGNDRVKGNDGADYAEGGPGTDAVDGNAGDDELIGGSSTSLTEPYGQAPTDSTKGQPDANDNVYGGSGDDLIAGDNGVMSRVGSTSTFLQNLLSEANAGNKVQSRFLQLLDVKNGGDFLTAPQSIRFGNDWISGSSGTDVAFGQDGTDSLSGGGGTDYLEGNGAADVIRGDLKLSDASPADPGENILGPISTETPLTTFTVANPAWPTDADPASTSDDPTSAAGQDDILGGTSIPAFRDGSDSVEGDAEGDFVVGDNGTMTRVLLGTAGNYSYKLFLGRYPTNNAPANAVAIRIHDDNIYNRYQSSVAAALRTTRFCTTAQTTCDVLNAYGDDRLFGDGGDDTVWGQDGNDYIRGGADNDSLYGELGDDRLYGDSGDDSMVGDRGGVVDRWEDGSRTYAVDVNQVPKVHYDGFVQGTVTRQTDLQHDIDGDKWVASSTAAASPHRGDTEGGIDRMRGGLGEDAMHGGFNDDLMNGDSGGDIVYGDDGADVMWGGQGCDQVVDQNTADCKTNGVFDPSARGTKDRFVDYLFGGKGAYVGPSVDPNTGSNGSDLIDWHPRGAYGAPSQATCTASPWPVTFSNGKKSATVTVTEDPCSWFVMTDLTDNVTTNNQHHQGIDWMYGGWDRDVLQGDVADNGPNPGDRLLDWNGTYNLYTHCNSAYGGYNDVRQHSPDWQNFLQQFVFSTGGGQLTTDAANGSVGVGTSAFDELALVYPGSDNDHGSGSAYPSTPGHFDDPNACAP